MSVNITIGGKTVAVSKDPVVVPMPADGPMVFVVEPQPITGTIAIKTPEPITPPSADSSDRSTGAETPSESQVDSESRSVA